MLIGVMQEYFTESTALGRAIKHPWNNVIHIKYLKGTMFWVHLQPKPFSTKDKNKALQSSMTLAAEEGWKETNPKLQQWDGEREKAKRGLN